MISKKRIIDEFKNNNLPIDKIRLAGKGDGWFVYHPNAFSETITKTKKTLVSQTEHSKTYLREKEYTELKREFIDDEELLRRAIGEAKNRQKYN